MKLSIPAGTTSKRIALFMQDSSSTTGAGLTGLAFNTASLVCYSWIDTDGNAGGTVQALATATLGTWTTIGFKEKDATNMPGWYEFGVPNALIASGVKWCVLHFKGATNLAPLPVEIEVTATSNQDAAAGGMTAVAAIKVQTDKLAFTVTNQVDANVIDWKGATAPAMTGDAFARLGAPAGASTAADIAAVKVDTAAAKASTAGLTFTVANQVDANPLSWKGGTIVSPNVTGVPKVDVIDWLGSAPNALISGRVDANAQVIASGAISASTFAANAITSTVVDATTNTAIEAAVWAQAISDLAAVPGTTDTAIKALTWLFELSRNVITQTSTTQLVKKADGTTTLGTSTQSDDGVTYTRGQFA